MANASDLTNSVSEGEHGTNKVLYGGRQEHEVNVHSFDAGEVLKASSMSSFREAELRSRKVRLNITINICFAFYTFFKECALSSVQCALCSVHCALCTASETLCGVIW